MSSRKQTVSNNAEIRIPKAKPMPRAWRHALDDLKSNITYSELEKIEQETVSVTARNNRRRMPIKELVVVEGVFQWRGANSNLLEEDRFMRELMRALELEDDLTPILIKEIGAKLYVVDGHHRLAAYATLGKPMIPVVFFEGDLRAAYLKSLEANVEDKLSLTLKDKYEAAFRLVKFKLKNNDPMTWEQLRLSAVVGRRLPYKMQKVLKDNPEAWEWTWAETLGKANKQNDDYQPDSDEFRERFARKLADEIMSKVHIKLTDNPDITAMALEMISEQLPVALIEEWMPQMRDVLIERAKALNSEETERAFEDAFAKLEKALEL